MDKCIHTYTHTQANSYIHRCTCTCLHAACTQTYVHNYLPAQPPTHLPTYLRTYITFIDILTYIYIYIYIHIYIYVSLSLSLFTPPDIHTSSKIFYVYTPQTHAGGAAAHIIVTHANGLSLCRSNLLQDCGRSCLMHCHQYP